MLINDPKVVLIDRRSARLAPAVVEQLLETLLAVRTTGLAMLLVEQNLEQRRSRPRLKRQT